MINMLQMGHPSLVAVGPSPLQEGSPLKRPRSLQDVGQQPSTQKIRIDTTGNHKNSIEITPAEQQVAVDRQLPQRSQAAVEQKEKLIIMRFKKALRRNDSTMLQRCLEFGYTPSVQEWLCIIGKMHVATAMSCVSLARTLEAPCISAAIRRQHKKLFKEVITRVEEVPRAHMQSLMAAPAYYLEICLNKGLDPNIPLKNQRLPLEHACAHSRISHIEILLKDTRTSVSQNVCRFMIRQNKQQKFAERAIELCDDIVPNMILEAIVANVTSALQSIMTKLEEKYEEVPQWDEITHMLRCPISQDYSADLVKTPVNDHYYDRAQLLTWVRSKGTDPLTREPLAESDLLLRSEFLKDYAKILQAKIQQLEK
jgi:hypothetical protein